jgi:hypothetical protein
MQGQVFEGSMLESTIIRAEHERHDKNVANTEAACSSVAWTLQQRPATALSSMTFLSPSVKAFQTS